MARLLWLADVLRAAGLTVHEVPGWFGRGDDTYGPVRGVIIHETRGSATSTDAGEINVLVNGRVGLSGPIAQLYLSRTGAWHVVASGTCHHVKTGWGGPFSGYGNDSLLGIEPAHGEAEDWAAKPAQYRSYVRGVAAILRHTGWPPPVGHKEHQPGDKPDPEFNMATFRADVAAALHGDDEMADIDPKTMPHLWHLATRVDALRNLQEVNELGEPMPAVTLLKAIAAKVDIDPAELAAIEAAAKAGAASAADDIVARILAGLPEGIPDGGLSRDDVEQAVRDAFAGGLAPEPTS